MTERASLFSAPRIYHVELPGSSWYSVINRDAVLKSDYDRLMGELQLLADSFARVVAWMRDPEAMESEAEMAEVADAALFRAEGVLDRGE